MKTFVIFDQKTGEILQTHVQMDDPQGSPEALLKRVRPEAQGKTVGIMAVESLTPGIRYQVDVTAKKLISTGGKATGAGGAFVQPVGGDPRMARTVVVPLGQKKEQST